MSVPITSESSCTATAVGSARPLIACPVCDMLLHEQPLQPGYIYRCPRCRTRLHKKKRNSIDKCLALSLTGLLLFLPAMLLPLLTFEVLGIKIRANVLEAVQAVYNAGYSFVALMVLLTSILFPLTRLGLLFLLSLSLRRGWRIPFLPRLFRFYIQWEEWGMTDVYLIGIMVTLIKMHGTAEVIFELGFYTFFFLVVLMVATQVVLDRRLFWQQLELLSQETVKRIALPPESPLPLTALAAGILRCHDCGKLSFHTPCQRKEHLRCPRCGAILHGRKPDALTRTWALTVSAAIFFLPANILPIMEVDFLGVPSASTIMDGIIYFFEEGEYGIGIIILTASVLVPLFKIVGLSILLLSIHFHRIRWLRQKTLMFQSIVFIGRWSMLDIFVIALLGVLVQFGFFSSIRAAQGTTWFTMVVICSMLAAHAFDTRMLWDILPQPHAKKDKTGIQPATPANGAEYE